MGKDNSKEGGLMKMTFKEWINKFHPECEDDMMEEQLMEEYATWQKTHSDSMCSFCATGEMPESSDLDGIL